jgi:fimbrial chaperone protein
MFGSAIYLFASILRAGSLDVAPVIASLSSDHAIQSFAVRNDGQSPETIQVTLKSWRQDAGQNVFEPTDELISTPPLFTIMPGHMQIVRVGLRHAVTPETEVAYRMFLREVPPPPQPGFVGLMVAMRLSIPVFIKPSKPAPAQLEWRVVKNADNSLSVQVTNAGSSHVKIVDVALQDQRTKREAAHKNTALYVLASKYRRLTVPAQGDVQVGDQLDIRAKTVDGEIHGSAMVQSG